MRLVLQQKLQHRPLACDNQVEPHVLVFGAIDFFKFLVRLPDLSVALNRSIPYTARTVSGTSNSAFRFWTNVIWPSNPRFSGSSTSTFFRCGIVRVVVLCASVATVPQTNPQSAHHIAI